MNTVQLNLDPKMGDEVTEDTHDPSNTPSNNSYYLRSRPNKMDTRYTML